MVKLTDYIKESLGETNFYDEEIPTPEISFEVQEIIDNLSEEVEDIYKLGGEEAILEWANQYEGEVNEGFLGGAIGFLTGPMIGKIVARALGVREGVLYDLLTSRLVSTALGSAIQKAMK